MNCIQLQVDLSILDLTAPTDFREPSMKSVQVYNKSAIYARTARDHHQRYRTQARAGSGSHFAGNDGRVFMNRPWE